MSKLHQQRHKTQKIGFILLRGFTMITFGSAVHVLLRSKNHIQIEYESWHMYHENDDISARKDLRLEHT